MGLRFYRRVRLCPGLSVNLSRSGPSLTAGIRGAHVTIGRRGITKTVGLPGTGLFYTERSGYHSGLHSAATDVPRTPEEHAAVAAAFERGLAIGLLLLILGIVAVVSLMGR